MADLILTPNLPDADDVYDRLVRLHDGLTDAESLEVWARLALALANHIGDPEAIAQAIAAARPTTAEPAG